MGAALGAVENRKAGIHAVLRSFAGRNICLRIVVEMPRQSLVKVVKLDDADDAYAMSTLLKRAARFLKAAIERT